MTKKKNKKKVKKKRSKISQPKKAQSDIKYPKLIEKTKNMLNQWGLPAEHTTFAEPSDGVKMSEVILKLAEPLLKKYGNNDKHIKSIISLAIILLAYFGMGSSLADKEDKNKEAQEQKKQELKEVKEQKKEVMDEFKKEKKEGKKAGKEKHDHDHEGHDH